MDTSVYSSTRVEENPHRPSHFIGRAPNGATRLRRRLLAAHGPRVISVPYYEWDPLMTDAAHDAYLSAKLV